MKLNYILKNFKKDIPSYIIAEVAQAHDGSLGYAHSFINLASSLGCDGVKFQVHVASQESSKQDKFRKNFSYLKESRYQYWKRMEFTLEQWMELKKHTESLNMEFICSIFSSKGFEMMNKINLKIWKIASGEFFNNELLINVAKLNKIVIISNGMLDVEDTSRQIKLIKNINNKIILLHCNSIYPTPLKDINLRQMLELRSRVNLPTGYSDHSGNPYSSIAAISLGANVIEIHLSFNKKQFGPDTSSSLTPFDFQKVIEANKAIYKTKGDSKIKKTKNKSIVKITKLFKKSLGVNKNLKKGYVLKKSDLCFKKPGTGINPLEINKYVGKKIIRDVGFDEILFKKDFEK